MYLQIIIFYPGRINVNALEISWVRNRIILKQITLTAT